MKKFSELLLTTATVAIPVVLQFIYIRYISYNVDKSIYGDFVLLQTLFVGLSFIFLQIPTQAYDRFYNDAIEKSIFINEFRTLLVVVNIASIFIIVLYGYVVNKFSYDILFMVFIYFMLLNNYSFNEKIFLLDLERGKFFFIKILESISKFITPIVAYYYFQTLFSFLAGIIIGYFFSSLVMLLFLKNYPFRFEMNLDNYKKYFTFAYPIFFASMFGWGISFSDRYFIEFLSGTGDVALYAILAQVAGVGQIFGQIYFMYVNPHVLKKYSKNKQEALLYLKERLMYLLIVFIILSLVAYYIPVQIYALLIDYKTISQPYFFNTFFILLIGVSMTVFQTAISMYFVLLKKIYIISYMNGLAFIVNFVGNFYIEDFGIIAAAVSTLLAYAVLNIGYIIYLYKIRNTLSKESLPGV